MNKYLLFSKKSTTIIVYHPKNSPCYFESFLSDTTQFRRKGNFCWYRNILLDFWRRSLGIIFSSSISLSPWSLVIFRANLSSLGHNWALNLTTLGCLPRKIPKAQLFNIFHMNSSSPSL